MFRANLICMLGLLVASSVLIGQDEAKPKSTPKAGDFMLTPFACLNINDTEENLKKEADKKGTSSKGRPHCLVCRFGLSPAVLMFAKAPPVEKEKEFAEYLKKFDDLLKKLDDLTLEFEEYNFQVGIIFITADARDSTNNSKEDKAQAIIDETVNRKKLVEQLTKRAEGLKNVIIACYPIDGPVVREAPPKGYKLDPNADLTVFFYERMKVIETFVFEAGGPDDEQVKMLGKKVDDHLKKKLGAK